MRKRKREQTALDKRILSVCSPMPASGVTLTAAALACVLAEDSAVSFAEPGRPYLFDAFGLGKRFLLSGFTDFFRCYEEGQPFRGPENLWHGVCWAVRPGGTEAFAPQKDLSARDILRLSERLPGLWTVIDCSGLPDEVLEGVLAGSDRILIVADPLPGRLIPASPRLQRLLYAFPRAVLAINPMNPGVHRKALQSFLGSRPFLSLPDMGAKTVYKAQYACVFPWDLPEGRAFASSLKKHEENDRNIWP